MKTLKDFCILCLMRLISQQIQRKLVKNIFKHINVEIIIYKVVLYRVMV